MMQFITEIKSKIDTNVPLLEEAIIFALDTKELFIDVNYKRIQINDICTVTDKDGLDNILAPLPGKFYFLESEKLFYKYTVDGWQAQTSTVEQYQELVELYAYVSEELEIEYVLLASEWLDNTYVIHNEEHFKIDATIKLSAPNVTEEQRVQLANAMVLIDESDLENNNLILKAQGTAPTIDIPVTLSVCIQVNGLNVIEDNLKSYAKTHILSANQGRVLNKKLGDLSLLYTTDKDNLVKAVNEIYLLSR